jgi:hypothetical protein
MFHRKRLLLILKKVLIEVIVFLIGDRAWVTHPEWFFGIWVHYFICFFRLNLIIAIV